METSRDPSGQAGEGSSSPPSSEPTAGATTSITALEAKIQKLEALLASADKPRSTINIRLKEPDTFQGTYRENVDRWIFQVEQYLRAAGESDQHRVVPIAAALLRGNAAAWWESICRANASKGQDESLCTWDQFKTGLTKAFKSVNREERARTTFSETVQTNSVTNYVAKFNNVCFDLPDLSDSEKYHRFFEGLKPNIRKQIILKGKPETFEGLVSEAERVDYILYRMPKEHYSFKESDKTRAENEGPTPMQLGAVSNAPSKPKFEKLTPELRAQLEKEKKCKFCRQQNCPGFPDTAKCPELAKRQPKGNRQ